MVIFRVKEGKVDEWIRWCHRLESDLHDEAMNTLMEERITEEFCALAWIGDTAYVFGFVTGEMLPPNMARSINVEHKKLKTECLEFVSEAEVMYQFNVYPNTVH